MLDAMRRRATSWVVKAFLVLLILSFAVWGIGDIFVGRTTPEAVARVGGVEIAPEELLRETERGFRTLREQLGGQLERTPAVMDGLLRQALSRLVVRKLVDSHARDLGLEVDPATLARIVREQPAFQGPDGFDRQRFDWILRELGMSEASYARELEGEILRSRLVDATSGAVVASEVLARELARHRGERRRGAALVVPTASIAVPAPEEAALEAWLEQNRAAFTVPELKTVELVVLSADDLLEEFAPSEEEIRAEYERRKPAYTTPAQRTAGQLLASDRAVIEEAARLLGEGKSMAEVASTLADRGLTFSSLGPVAERLLPEELDRALFALSPGEVSAPVQSPFGWHLLRLEKSEPETVKPLAEVRDELAKDLARRAAAERLPAVADRLDDALAAGEPLEAAARQVGARHYRLPAVDATGRDEKGLPIAEPALSKEMLEEIARLGPGQSSLLVHGKDDRYFVARVEAVTPARAQSLAEVRTAAEIGWRFAEQRRLARERARALLARLEAGATPADLAREDSTLVLHTIGPLRRVDSEPKLGPEVVRALFTAPLGKPAPEPAPTPDGFAVVVAEESIPAEGGGDPAPVRQELQAALAEAMLVGYERALRKRYPVEIDQRALARLQDQLGR
ncbi:MAG: peptidyl-prolyl cis-trans isomerase [Geminicoccaceae bacterium]|nr:peptidyl-prolyl cis-trans isomerase [Geminicoccaceae bacterium]